MPILIEIELHTCNVVQLRIGQQNLSRYEQLLRERCLTRVGAEWPTLRRLGELCRIICGYT